ncbi:unnamed protein product [Allacma fusca]|uniref:Uncharacterized protein n=1 Tax=Allacma fusca TaxID=39272 RepID=A0A8J2LJ80_9HEXA|nr:unnamed protein product [Allacma fusca]
MKIVLNGPVYSSDMEAGDVPWERDSEQRERNQQPPLAGTSHKTSNIPIPSNCSMVECGRMCIRTDSGSRLKAGLKLYNTI